MKYKHTKIMLNCRFEKMHVWDFFEQFKLNKNLFVPVQFAEMLLSFAKRKFTRGHFRKMIRVEDVDGNIFIYHPDIFKRIQRIWRLRMFLMLKADPKFVFRSDGRLRQNWWVNSLDRKK